jgi:hypothetical protein
MWVVATAISNQEYVCGAGPCRQLVDDLGADLSGMLHFAVGCGHTKITEYLISKPQVSDIQ